MLAANAAVFASLPGSLSPGTVTTGSAVLAGCHVEAASRLRRPDEDRCGA